MKWYNVNCTDLPAMQDVFQKEGEILGIIHFAAYKCIEESIKNLINTINNVESLEVVLKCMKENKLKI